MIALQTMADNVCTEKLSIEHHSPTVFVFFWQKKHLYPVHVRQSFTHCMKFELGFVISPLK